MVAADWMERLCDDFNRLWQQEAAEPLLLIPAFILDFLCIHPFRDGNGRMARLLTLLLLYGAGYEVGGDVSLERIIEESKESVLRRLEGIESGLARGEARPNAMVRLPAGDDGRRLPGTGATNGIGQIVAGSQTDLVQDAIDHFLGEFTIKDVERACPTVGRDMIRLVLKELRAAGRIEPVGKGRGAKWKRMG